MLIKCLFYPSWIVLGKNNWIVTCEEPYFIEKQVIHYENTPIQIYWKFHHQKNWKFSDKNSDIFHIPAQNIDCGYSLEPPLRAEIRR